MCVDGGFEHVRTTTARSPFDGRSSHRPTTQPSPRRACSAARQLGFVFSSTAAGDVTLGLARCVRREMMQGGWLSGRQGRGCRSASTAVPQQRADVTFGLGLSDRLVEFDVAVFPKPDMAVRRPAGCAVKDVVGSLPPVPSRPDRRSGWIAEYRAGPNLARATARLQRPDGVDPPPGSAHSRSTLLLAGNFSLDRVSRGRRSGSCWASVRDQEAPVAQPSPASAPNEALDLRTASSPSYSSCRICLLRPCSRVPRPMRMPLTPAWTTSAGFSARPAG